MQIKIHELASREFDEAIDWYEMQTKGLGIRFKKLVVGQLRKIKENPGWFPVEESNIFKAYIPKFPYKILYTFDKEIIVVLAIAHLHRKPWYWQSRRA